MITQLSGKALGGCFGAVNSFLRRKVPPAYQDGEGLVKYKECEVIQVNVIKLPQAS